MPNYPKILPSGDCGLLIQFDETIDLETNRRAHALAQTLRADSPAGLLGVVPGYTTLLVSYDPLQTEEGAIRACVETCLRRALNQPLPEPRRVEIPTHYGGEDGPDLADVARHTGLSEAEVVRIHSGAEYTVYFLGFLPGFPYLGGMDERIATPRLATPRAVVPAGSVGIAGSQTGVYPLESPGGWRLIGRTDLRLFDPAQTPPALLAPGDVVRFFASK